MDERTTDGRGSRARRLAAGLAVAALAAAGLGACSSGGSAGSAGSGGEGGGTTTTSAPGGTTTAPFGALPDPKAPFPCNLVSRGELASLGLIGVGTPRTGQGGTGFGEGRTCTWTADPSKSDGQPPSVQLGVYEDPDVNAWIAQSQSSASDVSRQHVSGVGDMALGRPDGEVSFITGKVLVELQLLPPREGKLPALVAVGQKVEERLPTAAGGPGAS